MALLLDPREPVEREIRGTKFLIRAFTSRQHAQFIKHLLPLQSSIVAAPEEGGAVSVDLTPEMVDHLEKVVSLGVAGFDGQTFSSPLPPEQLDRIPFDVWSELYSAILEVNSFGEGDAKN